MVRRRVGLEPILPAVERKPGVGDAVRIAADERAEEIRIMQIVVERVEAERDVSKIAVAVGNMQRRDNAAERDEAHLHTLGVGERNGFHALTALRKVAE